MILRFKAQNRPLQRLFYIIVPLIHLQRSTCLNRKSACYTGNAVFYVLSTFYYVVM
nr:MAG TPA: hypothetical protein [Caudoviricetes sp.]